MTLEFYNLRVRVMFVGLTDTGEKVQKWARVFSTRRWVILVARTRRKNREENSMSTFRRFRLWTIFDSSPVSVKINLKIDHFSRAFQPIFKLGVVKYIFPELVHFKVLPETWLNCLTEETIDISELYRLYCSFGIATFYEHSSESGNTDFGL